MENILFEYPVNNENSSFDDEFQVQKARTNKIKYTVIIAVFCALVMYFLSALFAKAALLFYLLTAFFTILAMVTGKMFVKYPRHFLYIKATENELQLAYYKDKKEDYHFQYNSIEEIRFADKNFTAVYIKEEGRKPYYFELNKWTPEQGFFLYTIPQILPNVFKGNSKEIAKNMVMKLISTMKYIRRVIENGYNHTQYS